MPMSPGLPAASPTAGGEAELPAALRPWAPWLQGLDAELLPVFADLLGRLEPLLGACRGYGTGGEQEPDGVAGLQRRGAYERLLHSEWMLAQELPDEFLRRAATGEHLFLARQPRRQRASRWIVALFDAGPLQLGAPRLAHLALAILLARRAREAGAEFRWGVLQQPGELRGLDDLAGLRALLGARTLDICTPRHWQAWRECLAAAPQVPGECWGIGSTPDDFCSHGVSIDESLDGKALQVRLVPGRQAEARLALPAGELARRLLGGHFQAAVRRDAIRRSGWRVSLSLPPMISPSANQVSVVLLDEPGVLNIRIPSAGQRKPSTPRRQLWSAGLEPLAMAFTGKTAGALLAGGGKLAFWKLPGHYDLPLPPREILQAPVGTANLLPCEFLHNGGECRLYLLDAAGRLGYWRMRHDDPRLYRVAEKVLGLQRAGEHQFFYLLERSGQLWLQRVLAARNVHQAVFEEQNWLLGDAEKADLALFCPSARRSNMLPACAVRQGRGGRETWRLYKVQALPGACASLELPPGARALGVLLDADDDIPQLVVLSADRRHLQLHGQKGARTFCSSPARIARASYSPLGRVVAMLTEMRELLVYSLDDEAMLLNLQCNGVADE